MKKIALLAFVLALTTVGCPCVRNAVNADEGLRWWLFSNFGASRICPEMQKRGVPLKLALLGPQTIGRFFPSQCGVRVNDAERTIVVDVTGSGYAVLPFTRRVGFYCGVSVEYKPDFRLEEDATYVWGRFSRVMSAPDLRLLGVENQVVSLATQTPLGNLATVLGQGVVESELSKGFTVVRLDDGDDFTLGILTPPQRPKRLFKSASDRVVLAQDVTEIRSASRDYLGPFEVAQSGAALYARLQVSGATVDYVLVDRRTGDAWRQPYEAAQPIGPPPATPISFGQAPAGIETSRTFPLEAGSYYLVVENRAPHTPGPLGIGMPFEPVAYVTYSVEMGSR
jgi:hypothetical protein